MERRRLIERSLIAGLGGLMPVPVLDDALVARARRRLLREIAEQRRVDVDEGALRTLAEPPGPTWLEAAGVGALAWSLLGRRLRRLAGGIFALRRADEALFTYQTGVLFDHYCARHHLGSALDRERAGLLRSTMQRAARDARSEAIDRALDAGGRGIARSWSALAGWVLRAPRRLLGRSTPEPTSEPVLTAPASHDSLRGRIATDLESVAVVYDRALTEAFDAAWAPHRKKDGE
jgi:hypothetical protein